MRARRPRSEISPLATPTSPLPSPPPGAEREPPPAGPRITLPALFVAFLQISLCGFGGPIVWVRRILVDRLHWLDDRDLADIIGLCQFLPGPNVVCITVCVGARFRGTPGALSALAGFIVIPWSLGFALGALYLQYAH